MFYKNISTSVKTFHGVTFKPGEIKEVSDYINHRFMILSDKPTSSNMQQKPSSEKPKKQEENKSEVKENDSNDSNASQVNSKQ